METLDVEQCFLKRSIVRKTRLKIVMNTMRHSIFFSHHVLSILYAFVILYKALVSTNELIRMTGFFIWGYLTVWNFAFQATFLLLAFVYDIYEWRDAQESPLAQKIAKARDIVFQALVVPYTLFVSSMFWSLYLYDRELVFPKVYDVILPWWFNHCVHTNITIIVLVETVLQARRHPVSLKLELILTTFIAVAYAVVYYSIFFFANRWLYNVFGVLTWWQVILYQIGIWASSYFFYFIQFPVNRLIHGSEPEKIEEEQVDSPQKKEETKAEATRNFEISSMKSEADTPFSSDNWSLKYRSLRDKFENSRL